MGILGTEVQTLAQAKLLSKFVSVRGKFLGLVLPIIVTLGGINSYISIRYIAQCEADGTDSRGHLLCSVLAKELANAGLSDDPAEIRRSLTSAIPENCDIVFVAVRDESGKELARVGSSGATTEILWNPIAEKVLSQFGTAFAGKYLRRYDRKLHGPVDRYICLGIDDRPRLLKQWRMGAIIAGVNIGFLAIATIAITLISALIVRPSVLFRSDRTAE